MASAPPLTPLLVDAKREYVYQLADILAPTLWNYFIALWTEVRGRHAAFRERVRDVQHWNVSVVQARSADLERQYPYLADLIAACCVSYTKVLGSIRLNTATANGSGVKVALPQTSAFVHSVFVGVAKELYDDPSLLLRDRNVRMGIVHAALDGSIRAHVPMQQLLQVYLGHVGVDQGVMDPAIVANDNPGGVDNFNDVDFDTDLIQQPQQPMVAQQQFAAVPQFQPQFAVQQQPLLPFVQQQPLQQQLPFVQQQQQPLQQPLPQQQFVQQQPPQQPQPAMTTFPTAQPQPQPQPVLFADASDVPFP
jgi:hypothetical protein